MPDETPILFLDIDGVLNDHSKLPHSPYCGIKPVCVEQFNRILMATNCRIVLSSAWRYMLLGGQMTCDGFAYLLATHGCRGSLFGPRHWPNIIGHTVSDEENGNGRAAQITEWLDTHYPDQAARPAWCVLDDLDLAACFADEAWRFVRTDGTVGLTPAEAHRAIQILSAVSPPPTPDDLQRDPLADLALCEAAARIRKLLEGTP